MNKKNDTFYDIVIIGGGIAGLYTAYRALLADSNRKICILEKYHRLGGRIHTYEKPDFPISIEYGAGRFHRGHRLLCKLLDDLGLTKKVVPIQNVNQPPLLKHLIDRLCHMYHGRKNDNDLEKSLYEYVIRHGIMNMDEFAYFEKNYGYSTELFYMNIKDAMLLLEDMQSASYLGLRGGLSQVVDGLESRLIELGCRIWKGFHVTNVVRNHEEFLVYNAKKNMIHCETCVLAIPKNDGLLKMPILRPIYSHLQSIISSPLCRIYAVYDKDPITKRVWFDSLTKTVATNALRLVIPIDKESGSIMISYSDDKYAKWWNHIYEHGGKRALKTELQRLVKQQFPWSGDNIVPKKIHIAYWNAGVGYWRTGIKNSEKIASKIARPLGDDVK